MSPFEQAAWSWYQQNVTPLVMEAGMLGRLVERLGMEPASERMFLQALNMIRNTGLRVQFEDER
jgi:hypothetical protein